MYAPQEQDHESKIILLEFYYSISLFSGKIRLDNEAKPYIKVTCKTLILIEFLIFLNENG